MSFTYIASSEVPSLKHETRDDTMECRTLIPKSFLSGTKSTKVLCGSRYYVIVKVKDDSRWRAYENSEKGQIWDMGFRYGRIYHH